VTTAKRWTGYLIALAVGAFSADLGAQLMQLSDGTFASKVVIYDLAGTAGFTVTIDEAVLPDGASTEAKQPAFGLSGTPSNDVLTVQGHSGMTPIFAALTDTSGTPLSLASDATHDSAKATGGPQGMNAAVAHGSDPTAVTAGDAVNSIANRDGVPFVVGGHPNVITREAQIEDADGAQTNAAIVTVSAGTKIVVTHVGAHCDGSTTGPTNIVVGFGTATLPARAAGGTSAILAAFDGVPAGGGFVKGNGGGILGVGADDEDVRITTEDPAGGACSVELSYYTVES
jgi:hypothetical protein